MRFASTISTVALLAALSAAKPLPSDKLSAVDPKSEAKTEPITKVEPTHVPTHRGGATPTAKVSRTHVAGGHATPSSTSTGKDFIGTGQIMAYNATGGSLGCLGPNMAFEEVTSQAVTTNDAACGHFTGTAAGSGISLSVEPLQGFPQGALTCDVNQNQLFCGKGQKSTGVFSVKQANGTSVLAANGVSEFYQANLAGVPAYQGPLQHYLMVADSTKGSYSGSIADPNLPRVILKWKEGSESARPSPSHKTSAHGQEPTATTGTGEGRAKATPHAHGGDGTQTESQKAHITPITGAVSKKTEPKTKGDESTAL